MKIIVNFFIFCYMKRFLFFTKSDIFIGNGKIKGAIKQGLTSPLFMDGVNKKYNKSVERIIIILSQYLKNSGCSQCVAFYGKTVGD